jgi:hydrogenase maturation protein HypF
MHHRATVRALPTRRRRRFRITGVVQGVGFRPFVHRLASRRALGGFVLNDGRGVLVEAEGEPASLDDFADALADETPPLAQIEAIDASHVNPRGESAFRIEPSTGRPAGAPLAPDAATCEVCLEELFDPADRRHRYPFINCTQCGPRLTIVDRVPYDRCNTTMATFEMCAVCLREYEDPADRRFHAEPNACPDCGPRLTMPLDQAVGVLRHGGILAVKGLGGFHLACDARSETAVARLRKRKSREERPFALMTEAPAELVQLDQPDANLLRSHARPIVVAPRRSRTEIAPAVAPGSGSIGVMLPYTPLHHLLVRDFGGPLVMTSGNRSGEPIVTDDADARQRLGEIADALLGHDRRIRRRCEDSVFRGGLPVRRSRGYAPTSLPLPVGTPKPVAAAGAELKSVFCVARGAEAFLSPHLGDLVNERAHAAFRSDVTLYLEMLGVRPAAVAHDLHPDYLSTRWALEQDAEPIGVQHHHAHAAACLAEHGETGPALALVLDGTGYGADGTIWGGELLRFDLERFDRVAHLEAVPMPGGEAAVREPWRMAAAYLALADRPVPFDRWPLVQQSLAVNAPLSSGAGRIFDAVAALLGVRERISYEGQAAIELEQLAGSTPAEPYPCCVGDGVIRGADLVRAAHDDLDAGRERRQIAAAFHEGLAQAAAGACAEAGEPRTVVLSGGVLQNLRLSGSLARRLANLGFRVLRHRRVPPNDGGIAFGQAAIAAMRLDRCA